MPKDASTGRAAQPFRRARLLARVNLRSGKRFLAGQPRQVLGIAVAALATLFLVSIGAVSKHLAEGMHPFMISFVRSLVAFLVLAPWFLRHGLGAVRTTKPWMHIIRGTCFTFGLIGWFWALKYVPLDLVTALGFSAQLFVILGAILFLKEPSRSYRWIGLAVGLVGALIIVRPGVAPMSVGIIVLLIGTVLFAATRLTAKVLSRTETPTAIVFWQLGISTLVTVPFAVLEWQWPTATQWAWFGFLTCLTLGNNFSSIWAIRLADMGTIEPVGFLQLVWAASFGLIFFHEVPNVFTLLGGAIIMGALVYMTNREQREKEA